MHGRLDFLQPLVDYMTPKNPDDRPSVAEALVRFGAIKSKLTNKELAQRLTPPEPEPDWERRWKDLIWKLCEFWWLLKPHRKLPSFS
jgi:hypothetical protein